MHLHELQDSRDHVDDPQALQARFEHDGCLLVRQAIASSWLARITEQAVEVLERSGVARRDDGWRWTGRPMPHIDDLGLNEIEGLSQLVRQVDDGSIPLAAAVTRACGRPMQLWRLPYFVVGVPDDAAYVTPPHQDNFAVAGEDRRRVWFPLTDIPSGDGGLAVVPGTHRAGRHPLQKLEEFRDRPAAGQSVAPMAPAHTHPRRAARPERGRALPGRDGSAQCRG
jgi:hypothetical protein